MELTSLLWSVARSVETTTTVVHFDEIDRLRSILSTFSLSRTQTVTLAYAWSVIHRADSESDDIYTRKILMSVFGQDQAVRHLYVLSSLVELGIMISNSDDNNWMMHHRVRFTMEFEEAVETCERTGHMPPISMFETEQSLVDAYIALGRNIEAEAPFFRNYRQHMDAVRQLMAREDRSPEYPLSKLLRMRNASLSERMAVAWLAYTETCNRMVTVEELHQIVRMQDLNVDSTLVGKGLAEYVDDQQFRMTASAIALTPAVRSLMKLEAELGLTGNDQYIGIVTPQQGLNDVIVEDDVRRLLINSVERFRSNVHTILAEWGIAMPGYHETSAARLVLLFYGPPGTGKTMAAYALAKELGRTVVTIDASTVLGSYVGQSERQLRMIFSRLAYVRARSSTPPVVVLNEADALLHNRVAASHAADMMQNNLVSILLEEMERFQGLLVLTVNDVERMDEAFSRRIDMKIFFDRPTAPLREQLWNLYLPSTIPGSDQLDRRQLAHDHPLTGGQIRTIVANACADAALRQPEERIVRMTDLRRFIDLECRGQFETTQRTAMGFIT